MASISIARAALQAAELRRGLEGFRDRTAAELQPTGIAELDAALGGGFPRGSLVELSGAASSGRTSVALSLLARTTQRQESCAFVDVSDSLDAVSLAAAGVDLPRLLWVRCGEIQDGGAAVKDSSLFTPAEDEAKRKANSAEAGEKSAHGQYWQHPRDQIRGVESAIPFLLRGKQTASSVVTKSARIQPIARSEKEQVERDRELPRRHVRAQRDFPRVVETFPAVPARNHRLITKPWKRLEQALKTTDLLLYSGGWGVVVFDLGGISWVDARRINLSVWFRFRRAVENTPTILLLVGEEPCAKSCASLVLRCHRTAQQWSRAVPDAASGVSIFEGFEIQGEVMRARAQSKSADSARWQTHTHWTSNF